MRSEAAALALLGAVALLALPPAAGQADGTQANQVRIEAESLDGPIEPLEDLARSNVTVEVTCGQVSENGTRAVDVEVTRKPTWIETLLSPSTVFVGPDDCDTSDGTATARTNLTVHTTSEAPAFQPSNMTLRASSDGLEPGTEDLDVVAGFYAVLDVQTPREVVVAGPDEVLDLPVEVTNFGNGRVEVRSEEVNRSGSEGLEVVLPARLVVGSNATGGENTRSSTVSVQTPSPNGYVNEQATFEVRWTARYEPDPSAGGAATTKAFRIMTKGFHVPGPGAAAVLAALGAAALAGGRRRVR